jgi:zinc finger RNA-binding protein
MRVGNLAKNTLIAGDTQVELIVLCSQIPTSKLLHQVAELFRKFVESSDEGAVIVTERQEDSSIYVTFDDFTCRVILTSVLLRDSATGAPSTGLPADSLPLAPCLFGLSELRHAKWYQVKCMPLQNASHTLRILRDIRTRVATWQALDIWTLELIVEKALASVGYAISASDAFLRVFQTFASGVLLNKVTWLTDPCEKEPTDVLATLKFQEREDITASAQHALRLMAFRRLDIILGIKTTAADGEEPSAETALSVEPTNDDTRKRPLEATEETSEKGNTVAGDINELAAKKLKTEPDL